mmetsp:Transcript_24938/g.71053  ORF Transcript_24938/g.71053 Transcript_24938/m.71053 type:complete len:230 (-) Transcript_24938:502-1191(-)
MPCSNSVGAPHSTQRDACRARRRALTPSDGTLTPKNAPPKVARQALAQSSSLRAAPRSARLAAASSQRQLVEAQKLSTCDNCGSGSKQRSASDDENASVAEAEASAADLRHRLFRRPPADGGAHGDDDSGDAGESGRGSGRGDAPWVDQPRKAVRSARCTATSAWLEIKATIMSTASFLFAICTHTLSMYKSANGGPWSCKALLAFVKASTIAGESCSCSRHRKARRLS